VKMAFKVFNSRDEAQYQRKAQLLAAALRPPPPTSRLARQQLTPPGACFKCNQMGHWARNCPSSHLLPGPCPQGGQNDTGESTAPPAPLCLCKVDQSPIPTFNRVKASRTSWAWWQKANVALGPQPPWRSLQRSPG
jgi:hypothetical protein